MASKLSQSIATYTRLWYQIDAKDQIAGRLAVLIVKILQGKTKPIYHPAVDVGDFVVVKNTKDIMLTGRKWHDKIYRHHSGYPGGLKEITADKLHTKDPTKVLYKAVNGMLPKNQLRKRRMKRLYLFPGEDHPYGANITHKITNPSPLGKKLSEYSEEEKKAFPKLVNIPHL